jgi:uncharacterized membrane protein HdeD (DUF308 family)
MSTQLNENQVATSHAAPSFGMRFPVLGIVRESLAELRANWYWFVVLGAALMLLGLMAVSYSVIATLAAAIVFGYILVAAGVFYIVGAFFTRAWGGFFLSLLAGILHLAVGVIVLDRPNEAVLLYTLLLAAFFFVEGLFRIIAAVAGRFHHWGWMLLNGVVTLALGIMIWQQWPLSGMYVVGLFLGINLVISGANYLTLGLIARRLPV